MASAVQERPACAGGGRRDLYAAAPRSIQVLVYGGARSARDDEVSRPRPWSRQRTIFRERRRARDTHDTGATRTRNMRNAADAFHTRFTRSVISSAAS